MAKTEIFTGTAPATLNIEQLKQEVAAVAPEVEVTFIDGISWQRWPYGPSNPAPQYLTQPQDVNAPYEQPDVLILENVPEEITRQQIRNFILNHVATKSSEQEAKERAAARIVRTVLRAPDEVLLQLKNKLLSL